MPPTEQIIASIAEALESEPNSLHGDAGLGRHPKWDSLGHLRVMLVLEKKYGVILDENTMTTCTSIKSILDYFSSKYSKTPNQS
jgi:acyl carrier protein